MSQLTYYVASSLDGFIAHEDGTYDGFVWDEALVSDFFSEIKKFDAVLMGRKTYDVGLKEGKTSPYPWMRQVVFSRTMDASPDNAVELVKDNPIEFTRELLGNNDQNVWLCGGGNLASQLLGAGLIDRVVVKLNPVLFGSGIPIFANDIRQSLLELTEMKKYDSGIIVMHYKVKN